MIDQGLGEPWPDEVHPGVQPFLQGHLIKDPPFAYGADLRYAVWSATRSLAEETAEDERGIEVVDVAPENRPPYGIITSQTCDLTEEDRSEPRQPWFGVFPVYKVDPDTLPGPDYIFELDPPDVEGGTWVADMRVELPLEKSVLVGRDPIAAFPTEDGYIEFANAMARRKGRPALASVFHDFLSGTAREINRNNSRKKQSRRIRTKVLKWKLDIQEGTRLEPKAARLYIVTQGEPDDDTKDWFGAWWDEARQVAEEAGLELLPVSWINENNIDFELYERLVDIRSPI